jgi:hypothetical protein
METGPADTGTGADARAAPNDGAGAGSAEAELVADFAASAIFRAAPSSRARPNSLASIERRWFVGKQTKRSADALAAGLLGDDQQAKVSEHFVLIGTVALLQLARAGHHVIQAKEPRGEGEHLEITIHVPTTRRGRPKKDAIAEARLIPSRVYFVNPKLAAVCEEVLDTHSSALPGLLQEERRRNPRGSRRGQQHQPMRFGSASQKSSHADGDALAPAQKLLPMPPHAHGPAEPPDLADADLGDDGAAAAMISLTDAAVGWLPREESWSEPLPEMETRNPSSSRFNSGGGTNSVDTAPVAAAAAAGTASATSAAAVKSEDEIKVEMEEAISFFGGLLGGFGGSSSWPERAELSPGSSTTETMSISSSMDSATYTDGDDRSWPSDSDGSDSSSGLDLDFNLDMDFDATGDTSSTGGADQRNMPSHQKHKRKHGRAEHGGLGSQSDDSQSHSSSSNEFGLDDFLLSSSNGERSRSESYPPHQNQQLSLENDKAGKTKRRKMQMVTATAFLSFVGAVVMTVLAVQEPTMQQQQHLGPQAAAGADQGRPSPPIDPGEAVRSNKSFACNVGCPPSAFAIGRTCHWRPSGGDGGGGGETYDSGRDRSSISFAGGHCAEWRLEGTGKNTSSSSADGTADSCALRTPTGASGTAGSHDELAAKHNLLRSLPSSPAAAAAAATAVPWPSTWTRVFGQPTVSPVWSGGRNGELWMYTTGIGLGTDWGDGLAADCPSMWRYSHAESRWFEASRPGTQFLSSEWAGGMGGLVPANLIPADGNAEVFILCGTTKSSNGESQPAVAPSTRVAPETFTDVHLGLLFLYGGTGCDMDADLSTIAHAACRKGYGGCSYAEQLDRVPYGNGDAVIAGPHTTMCNDPHWLSDMWAFSSGSIAAASADDDGDEQQQQEQQQQQRWMLVEQKDADNNDCGESMYQRCGTGTRDATLITGSGSRMPTAALPVGAGSFYVFGGLASNTRVASSRLWRFSYTVDGGGGGGGGAISGIIGSWAIIAMQREQTATTPDASSSCTFRAWYAGSPSDYPLPSAVCEICDLALCPDARAGAAGWSGSGTGGGGGWIFGGYDTVSSRVFNDLWRLNPYESVLGDAAGGSPYAGGGGGGGDLEPPYGPRPITLSRTRPLWRQITPQLTPERSPASGDASGGGGLDVSADTALRMSSSSASSSVWPMLPEFNAMGDLDETGALWLLVGYGKPMDPLLQYAAERHQKGLVAGGASIWSFDLSTEVWSVSAADTPGAGGEGGGEGSSAVWPAARTHGITVGEWAGSSRSNGGGGGGGTDAGWLVGGLGDRECPSPSPSPPPDPTTVAEDLGWYTDWDGHTLNGLWRLALVDDEQQSEGVPGA